MNQKPRGIGTILSSNVLTVIASIVKTNKEIFFYFNCVESLGKEIKVFLTYWPESNKYLSQERVRTVRGDVFFIASATQCVIIIL